MIIFQVSLKNSENMMPHLYFNKESDYSEENTWNNEVFHSTILHHRKKLTIFTVQLPTNLLHAVLEYQSINQSNIYFTVHKCMPKNLEDQKIT